MKKILLACLALAAAVPALATELSVPEKKSKSYYISEAERVNGRSSKGYLPIWAAVIIPLEEDAFAILNGVVLGKRNGDSFHYFENADIAFTCHGTGRPNDTGGVIRNECFLSRESTGVADVDVPKYGKVAGSMMFPVALQGEPLGLAGMRWGLSLPSKKTMLKMMGK